MVSEILRAAQQIHTPPATCSRTKKFKRGAGGGSLLSKINQEGNNMQSVEIEVYFPVLNANLKDLDFFSRMSQCIKSMSQEINNKISDDVNKQECFKHLSLALHYLASGLKERPINSNSIMTR